MKCNQLILCKFPLFSTVELNLSLDSKLEFLTVLQTGFFENDIFARKMGKIGQASGSLNL